MSVPWTWPPPIPGSSSPVTVSTDDVTNTSTVAGATATDALNSLKASVARYPNEAAILAQLPPLHWWSANHTVQSGGLVDTITDIGSSPKNFTQAGASRCATGVDGNGQTYLNFAGAQFYRAGVAADWTFANNGTACTYAYILSRTSLAVGFEEIFGTAANDTTKSGFDISWGFVSSSDQGPFFTVVGGSVNQYVVYTETALIALNSVYVVIVRTVGQQMQPRTSNGVTNTPFAAFQSVNGQPRSFCTRNLVYNTAAPVNPLTLGRRADLAAGQFLNARVYDVVIHNDAWSDAQCELFIEYARTRQGLVPEYGWPTTMTP